MTLGLAWRLLLSLAIVSASAWGFLALRFRGPRSGRTRGALIGLWLGFGVFVIVVMFLPPLRPARTLVLGEFALVFLILLVWWLRIRPTHARDWAPDVARLLDSRIDGDRVTLHNVRNFVWRTREEFDVHWQTRHYDLSNLASVDLIVSYWMGPAIAHTLVSFGFGDGRQLVFSVEVRRTRGQAFSFFGGFFKQSELAIVAAEERDIVRTRSNVRGENVYLYRIAMPEEAMRAVFVAYLRQADTLRGRPRFYNTLFSNCTTLVFAMVRQIVPGLPKDIRLVFSGHLPEYIYDLGALDTTRTFDELKRRGHINARARAHDTNDAAGEPFSCAIRRGVPAADGGLIVPANKPARQLRRAR